MLRSSRALVSTLLLNCLVNLPILAMEHSVPSPKSRSETDAEKAYRHGIAIGIYSRGSLPYYNEAIRLNPKYTAAYRTRAAYYAHINELKLAVSDLDIAISIDKNDLWAIDERARYHARLQNWPQALAGFTRVIELSPSDCSGYENRSKVYRHLGRPDLAEKDKQKVQQLWKTRSRKAANLSGRSKSSIHSERARNFMQRKQYARAIKEFDSAIALNDEIDSYYCFRGECHEHLGNLKLALQDFNAVIEIDPATRYGYEYRAGIHEKLGHADLAKKDLDRQQAIRAGKVEVKPTIATYTRRIKAHPDHRSEYVWRGRLFKDTQKYREAIVDLTKAISMNPEDSSRSNYNLDQIYYDRASCFEKLGEFKLALADYTSILKLDSEQEEAYLYRGNCNARLGRWENALADYTLCIKHDIEPTAAPYLARAKAYEKLGKMESAKQDYQKANELKR